MTSRPLFVWVTIITALTAAVVHAKTVKVFALVGDSNTVGR